MLKATDANCLSNEKGYISCCIHYFLYLLYKVARKTWNIHKVSRNTLECAFFSTLHNFLNFQWFLTTKSKMKSKICTKLSSPSLHVTVSPPFWFFPLWSTINVTVPVSVKRNRLHLFRVSSDSDAEPQSWIPKLYKFMVPFYA